MSKEISKTNIFCEDKKLVITLSSEPPIHKHSEVLDVLMGFQKKQHLNIIDQMQAEIETINLTMDKDVHNSIDQTKEELSCIQAAIVHDSMTDLRTQEEWSRVYDIYSTSKKQICSTINELYMELLSSESKRKEEIEKVLPKYKEEMMKIRFVDIGSIDRILHETITNINKKTLSNLQKYEDLKLDLCARGHETLEKYQLEFKCRAKAEAHKRALQLFKKINKKQHETLLLDALFNLKEEHGRARETFFCAANRLEGSLSEVADTFMLPMAYEINKDFWESWIDDIQSKLNVLDSMRDSVASVVKIATSTFMEHFDDQINAHTRSLTQRFMAGYYEMDQTIEDVTKEINILKKIQTEELEIIQASWKEPIQMLMKKNTHTKTFISDLRRVWSKHLARLNGVSAELETTFNVTLIDCEKLIIDANKKIETKVKAIREAGSLKNLELHYRELEKIIFRLVETLKEKYYTHSDTLEKAKTKGTTNIVTQFKNDLHSFLKVEYQKQETFGNILAIIPDGPSRPPETSNEVTQVGRCTEYINAVDQRILGIYEMLEQYYSTCEEVIKDECEKCLCNYEERVTDKINKQLDSIYEKHSYILKNARDIRSNELTIHSERLISHVNAMNNVSKDLTEQYERVQSKTQDTVSNFNRKLQDIINERPTCSVRQIVGLISELEREWNLMFNSVNNLVSDSKAECEKRIEVVKLSSNYFSSVAKSFKNGGNYSPEELKTLNKELKLKGKTFSTQTKTVLRNYDRLVTKLSRHDLDDRIEHLQEVMKKLELRSKLENVLSILRVRLRAEVHSMSTAGKTIADQIETLQSQAAIDLKTVNSIVTLVNARYDYLMLPSEVQALENKQLAKVTEGNTDIQLTNTLSKEKTYQSGLLFKFTADNISAQENNFLSVIKSLILNKHKLMLDYTQTAYNSTLQKDQIKGSKKKVTKTLSKRPSMVRTAGKVSPKKSKTTLKIRSETGFKSEVEDDLAAKHIEYLTPTLCAYNDECELAWYFQTKNLLCQIAVLRETANSCIEKELGSCQEKFISRVLNLQREFVKNTQHEITEGTSQRDKIRRALVLPLAHPSHEGKLKELQERAKSTSQTCRNIIDRVVTKYKESLQHEYDEFVQQMKLLVESLKIFQDLVFDNEKYDVSRLIDIIKDMKYQTISNTEVKEKECNILDSSDEESRIREKYQNSVYPQSIWSLNQLPEDMSNFPYAKSEECDESQINNIYEIKKTSVMKTAIVKFKESANLIEKLYEEAKTAEKSHKDEISIWLQSFKKNIAQSKRIHMLCE